MDGRLLSGGVLAGISWRGVGMPLVLVYALLSVF